MNYLIMLIMLITMCVSNAQAENSIFKYDKNIIQEQRELEKIFSMSTQERQNIEDIVNTSSSDIIGFYPVLKITFFTTRNPQKYKDKTFTKTFKPFAFRKSASLGVNLRLTIGYANR